MSVCLTQTYKILHQVKVFPEPMAVNVFTERKESLLQQGGSGTKAAFGMTFWSQLLIMLRRNTILQYRYLNSTLSQTVIAPFLFSLLIFILQADDHANQSLNTPYPPLSALDGVYQCQGRNFNDPCVSIFWIPATVVNAVNYTQIMNTFSKKNAQRTGYLFQFEPTLTDPAVAPTRVYDMVQVSNPDFIYNYALQNPNTTAWGITFNQNGTGSSINVQYQV